MIPSGPSALTPEWLTQALRSTGTISEESTVASLADANQADDRGIGGQHARLRLTYDQAGDNTPTTLYVKFSHTDPQVRKDLHDYKMYLREVKFYQELASQVPLHTPRCYYSDIDMETGECVLLLEDMSGWRNGSFLAGCSAQEAELVVQQLATLHAAWWENPRLGELDYAHADPAYFQLFKTWFQQSWPRFLERAGEGLSGELVVMSERVGRNIPDVMAHLFTTSPQTLIHYDAHLDNIFFGPAKEKASLAFIDWQLYFVGRGVYDVAYFLGGNLVPEVRRSCEMSFLRMYHDLLLQYGVSRYSFETCLHDYRFLLLEGFFRVVFNAACLNLTPEQERAHIDVYGARFLQAILDLDAAELLPA